jgi:hypothetical protein
MLGPHKFLYLHRNTKLLAAKKLYVEKSNSIFFLNLNSRFSRAYFTNFRAVIYWTVNTPPKKTPNSSEYDFIGKEGHQRHNLARQDHSRLGAP